MDNESKRIVSLGPNAQNAIIALKLWQSPDANNFNEEEMDILKQIINIAPQFVPPHIKMMIDAHVSTTQCRLDRLFEAESLYGPGFFCKAVDEDDVFDEVLVAVFIDRSQFRLCRYVRNNFKQQYVYVEFPECRGCEKPCSWED